MNKDYGAIHTSELDPKRSECERANANEIDPKSILILCEHFLKASSKIDLRSIQLKSMLV